MTRQSILDKITEKRAEKTSQTSNAVESRSRGETMNELIREASVSQLELYKFNDMVDFDIDVSPGHLWEELQMFNIDLYDDRLQLELNSEKKYLTIQMNDPETDQIDFKVKVKFFCLNKLDIDNEESQRIRIKFIKKQGDLQKWYDCFEEMKDNILNDILMTPESNENKELAVVDYDESTKSE